ncbi:MAG: ABC transporter substrate-binding protein [Candidatus Lambdaproteobacteria bacterium]|nr:ABC transporter substrate-binding protein [Candidatus Lambdaproteobacteria bacterium]
MKHVQLSLPKALTRFTQRGIVVVLAIATTLALAAGCKSKPSTPAKFVFANTSNYDTMDPHQAFDVGRVAVRLNLYDGLYRWHDNPPKIEPWLAESYTVSPDGLTWTFKLKQGSKFHDGSEVTADDVVYSTERIFGVGKGAASLFTRMLSPGSTKAVDKYTVQFTLSKPSAIFLSIVPEVHVVNSKLVKEHVKDGDWGAAWLSENDAGSGSYMLTKYDPAVGWTATRFADHFYGWGDKFIPEIEFRTVSEINTRVLGMINGDYHGTDGYLPQDQVKRLKETETVKVLEQESMRIFMFQLHNQRAPTSDVHVRRAISYAFDYDGFIKNILGGSAERNPVPIPNNMWGVPKDVTGYTYDLEKAKAELAMAKSKPKRSLTIGVLTGYAQTEQAATLLQNGLRQIGVESKIESFPWPVIVGNMSKPETSPDISIYWISTYYADPNNWIGEMFHSGGWGTFKSSSFYKNPKVDDLLDKALKTTNQEERAAAYADAARIVYNDAGGVWVYNTKWFGPFAKNVEGMRFSPVGEAQEIRWMYFQ